MDTVTEPDPGLEDFLRGLLKGYFKYSELFIASISAALSSLTKKVWKVCFGLVKFRRKRKKGRKFFFPKKNLNRKCFWAKFFWLGNFFGPKKFGSDFFWTHTNLGRNFFWTKKCWSDFFLRNKILVRFFFYAIKFCSDFFFTQ